MEKLLGLMAAAVLAASAGSAMAEGGAQKQPGVTQQQGAQEQKAAQAQPIKRHQVMGRIVDIDREDGELKIQTEQGQLEFDFPPASLQGYKEGDEVHLDVSIRPAKPQPAPQPKQLPAPQPKQEGGAK